MGGTCGEVPPDVHNLTKYIFKDYGFIIVTKLLKGFEGKKMWQMI